MIFDYSSVTLKSPTILKQSVEKIFYNIKIFREQKQWSFDTSTSSHLSSTIKIVWKLHPSVSFVFQTYSSLLSLWSSPVSSW